MPLPKAPTVLGDMLSDFGPEAHPEPKQPAKRRVKKAPEATTETPKVEKKAKVTAKKKVTSKAKTDASKRRATPSSKAKKTPQSTTQAASNAPEQLALTPPEAPAKTSQATSVYPTPEVASVSASVPSESGTADKTPSATPSDDTLNEDLLRTPKKASVRLTRHLTVAQSNVKRLYVLDTNVLLHDPISIFRFQEHDVLIPMTVLEELDNHKTGLSDVARNGRKVSRLLDELTLNAPQDLSQGIELSSTGQADALGKLFFEIQPMCAPLPEALPVTKNDNRILATAKAAMGLFPERTIVLVSKDINMRLKATMLGIPAEDYLSDKIIDDQDVIYSGHTELPTEFWNQIQDSYQSENTPEGTIISFNWPDAKYWVLNEFLTVSGDPNFMAMITQLDGQHVTARLLKDYRPRKHNVFGVHARNPEQNMALNLLMDPQIDFVTLLGRAGTGKTLLALAAALEQTVGGDPENPNLYSDIIVTRATVAVKSEDIGFLPGSETEKMQPWMGAMDDNIEVLYELAIKKQKWRKNVGIELLKQHIQSKSTAFMRGRTFHKKFLIIDEAQNLSAKQMKTLITRAGQGTKVVCLGNVAQIDDPYLTEGSSGLTYVVDRFKNFALAGTVTLEQGERSRLADYAVKVL